MDSVAHNFSLDFAYAIQELYEAQKIPSSLPGAIRWIAKLCATRRREEIIKRRCGDGWPRRPRSHKHGRLEEGLRQM